MVNSGHDWENYKHVIPIQSNHRLAWPYFMLRQGDYYLALFFYSEPSVIQILIYLLVCTGTQTQPQHIYNFLQNSYAAAKYFRCTTLYYDLCVSLAV